MIDWIHACCIKVTDSLQHFILSSLNIAYDLYNDLLYGGENKWTWTANRTYRYRFINGSETTKNCIPYYRFSFSPPYLQILLRNYILIDSSCFVIDEFTTYLIFIREGKVHFQKVCPATKPAETRAVPLDLTDHDNIYYAALIEKSSDKRYDVTKFFKDTYPNITRSQLCLFEILPALHETYNIRYSEPEDLLLEIILADTLDTLTFEPPEMLTF